MTYSFKNVKDFNLDHIFDCGQCFRWEKNEDGSYLGVALNSLARISYENGEIVVDELLHASNDDRKDKWAHYLDLERDYGKIKEELSNDETLAKAIKAGEGIRILNQDPWETLISFIVSQNNNIPRIKKCIDGICKKAGKRLGEYEGKEYYDFPSIAELSKLSKDDLAEIHLGYRDKYIIDTTAEINADSGKKLYLMLENKDIPSKEIYEYLLALQGVGPKVANCILLFGFARFDSFPIDVWVKHLMNELYGFDEENTKGMAKFAKDNFGDLAGIAQQYLFRYIRWRE